MTESVLGLRARILAKDDVRITVAKASGTAGTVSAAICVVSSCSFSMHPYQRAIANEILQFAVCLTALLEVHRAINCGLYTWAFLRNAAAKKTLRAAQESTPCAPQK